MIFSFNRSPIGFEIKRYPDKATMLADAPACPTIGYIGFSYSGGATGEYDRYVFSASEPEKPTEDLLWLQIGNGGSANLPVLLDGSLYVYPIKAQLYKNEAWHITEAFAYVDEWKPFGKVNLYSYGDVCEETGGEWDAHNLGYSGISSVVGVVVNESNYLACDYTKEKYGTDATQGMVLVKSQKIDLTYYKTLTIEGLFEYENTNSHALYGVWKDFSGANYREAPAASAEYTANNTEPVVIDVSALEGEHFIGVGMRSCRVRIDECYLEM